MFGRNRNQLTHLLRFLLVSEEMHLFKSIFLNLHFTDQVAFFLELDEMKRTSVLKFLPPSEIVHVFHQLGLGDRRVSLTELDDRYISDMLNSMLPTEAAALLKCVSVQRALSLLQSMEADAQERAQQLIEYPAYTAGVVVSTFFSNCKFKWFCRK